MAQPAITVPIEISFLTTVAKWTLQSDIDDDAGLAVFSCQRCSERGQHLNAWQVRDRFLRLRTTRQLAAFLAETGFFDLFLLTFSNLTLWQGLVTHLLRVKPQYWPKLADTYGQRFLQMVKRNTRLRMSFDWEGPSPLAAVEASTTAQAIIASVQIDHLRGARFRVCARPDCGRVYEVQSKHERMYCEQYCAHLVSLRRKRALAKQQRAAFP
jgi:hypothetical protein